MQADQGDAVLTQIRGLLQDPVRKKLFVDSQRERWLWLGWSYRQAHARVDQMLNAEDHHFLDVRAQADVIRIAGTASFLDPLFGLEQIVRREKRMTHVEPSRWRESA